METQREQNLRLGRRVALGMIVVAALTLGFALATTSWRRANDHAQPSPPRVQP